MSLSIDNIKDRSGETEILNDLNKQIKNIHFDNYDEEIKEFTEIELKEIVNNKINYIKEGLLKIPFKIELNSEVKSIQKELDNINQIVKLSRKDTLETRNRNLDLLIKRYERLKEKSDNILQKDNELFKIHKKPLDEMLDYRNNLENKYGKFFFVHMTGQEREDLLVLYMKAYNVSREHAEKTLDNSYEHSLKEYNKAKE